MCDSYLSRLRILLCLCALFIFSAITFSAAPAPFQSSGNITLNKPAQQSSTSPWSHPDDAQGAVDGIKNGSFGFHTNIEKDPWWQVDLLAESTLNEIRIYNRIDAEPARAETIRVLLSSDGRNWKRVFPPSAAARIVGGLLGAALGQAPGPPPPQKVSFGGADGKPLVVDLKLAKARYVRLQLDETQYFHLDEVEIYGTSSAPPTAPVQSVAAAVAPPAPAAVAPVPATAPIPIPAPATQIAGSGSYQLKSIEVSRKYPATWGADLNAYRPGAQTLTPDQRTLRLGWDFNWGDAKQNRNRSMSDLVITSLPTLVEPGEDANFAASMRGDWNTSGYGNGRDHTIRLTGALGNGQWTTGGDPNGPYEGSFTTTNKTTVPAVDNGVVVVKSTATVRFGDDHVGEMEMRFIYEPAGRPLTSATPTGTPAPPATITTAAPPAVSQTVSVPSGQSPSISVGSYGLSRIELTRGYNISVPDGAFEAGLEILPADERNLRVGWDFNWGNNKQDRNRSISDLTIADIPSVVRPGTDVSLAAAMKAEWISSGYGNNDREHKISLTGALGNGQWTDNGANPNVPALGSFSTTNKFTVPREENGMVVLKSTAGIRMGADHTGDMEIRFVYEPASAFLRSGTASLDLETGTLDGWYKTGNAFDFQPTYQDNPTSRGREPSNHVGTYWVGTYEKRHLKTDNAGEVQGDGPTGTLTSVPFTIAGRKMSILVGGGCELGLERVELAVAGRAVRKATGKCTESMERVNWDVSDYVGQAGQIRLIDASGGGWGHINYDDVQMTELMTISAAPPATSAPAARPAAAPAPATSAAAPPPPAPAAAATPASAPAPSPAPPPPGFSVLSFGWELVDANSNKMLEGGERFNIRVTVKNSGAAAANNVQVRLAGDPTVVSAAGSQKSAGNIGPGQSQSVDFGGIMPSQLEPRNADILVSLIEGTVELPQTQLLRVGLAPADVRPTTTVLSEVVDVDYPPAPVSIPERTSSVAVIIGISNYRESVIPELPYAGRDAEIFAKYLENVGGVRKENIKILSDDRAARSDIEETVEEWLPLRVTETSHVYLYYAGHGALDPSTGETYLVPYEGSPDSPTTRMYPIKRLYEKLGALKVQNVTVFLDSCFSGGGRSIAMKGRPIVINSQAASAPSPVSSVSVLAAASANQVSSDYEKTHHGLFTYFLLKGIRGEADTGRDSWVDLGELFNYVRDKVRSTAVSELNREQTPTLTGGSDLETKKNIKLFQVKK